MWKCRYPQHITYRYKKSGSTICRNSHLWLSWIFQKIRKRVTECTQNFENNVYLKICNCFQYNSNTVTQHDTWTWKVPWTPCPVEPVSTFLAFISTITLFTCTFPIIVTCCILWTIFMTATCYKIIGASKNSCCTQSKIQYSINKVTIKMC